MHVDGRPTLGGAGFSGLLTDLCTSLFPTLHSAMARGVVTPQKWTNTTDLFFVVFLGELIYKPLHATQSLLYVSISYT